MATTASLRQGYCLVGERQGRNARLSTSSAGRPAPNVKSERPDKSFLAQAGDPAFLNLLRFVLNQFLLDISAGFGQ